MFTYVISTRPSFEWTTKQKKTHRDFYPSSYVVFCHPFERYATVKLDPSSPNIFEKIHLNQLPRATDPPLRHKSMVVEMVPLKGGIGSIFHPPGSARTISGI